MMRRLAVLMLVCLGVSAVDEQWSFAADDLPRRWVYVKTNLQVTEYADQLADVLRRSKAAGYNGVLLADYKLNVLDRVTNNYFVNARRIRALCEELKLELVPAIGSFGYSSGILAYDANLAEGLPVREMPMVARNGRAELATPPQNMVPGEFEQFRDDRFSGWNFQDEPGSGTYVDRQTKRSGTAALRVENAPGVHGNRRVSKRLSVRPFAQYHASVWIKSEGFESANDVRMFAIGEDGRVLSYSNLSVQRDQDWTEHHVMFNSLESRELQFYLGVWDAHGGKLWLDDARVVEEPFVNLVRRDACPLVVTNEDGTIRYTEGRDFAPLHDSRLGNNPYAGEYTIWHQPPQLTLLPESRIQDGQTLKVSYYHTVIIHDGQVCCSLSDPKVFEILTDQVRRIDELYSPRVWMLSHDEIRIANWSAADERAGKSAGELLADNVKRSVDIIRRKNPQAEICVWSDMFDPHHNARDKYYLVRGDLSGSWEGLPPDVTIINWNHGKADKSLPFFGQRGHRQILAGYYDHAPEAIRDWLAQAKPTDRVDGVMYTTWRNNYKDLDTFARAAWTEPVRLSGRETRGRNTLTARLTAARMENTAAKTEPVRLSAVQDNSIVMVDKEWSLNAGASGRIRIKGNQHVVAMSFDLSAIRGKRIKRAELVCHAASETISAVSISTIAAPWQEMTSSGLTAGIEGVNGWGYAGARFPAVVVGNAFTQVHQAKSNLRDGLYHWEIPADMVHAMSTGTAFGLAIHEHDADYSRNPTIFSREQSGKQPYLLVEVDDQRDTAPLPPSNVKLHPVDGLTARLTLEAPRSGFAYEVVVDGQPLGRHNIPLVSPGAQQTIFLRDLPDSITRPGMHTVQVVTISRTGQRSNPATVRGELFRVESTTFPTVPSIATVKPGVADLAVIPVTDKYDQRGQPVGDLPQNYRTHNALFDGQRIRLTAAAGEVVGFQALVRGEGNVSLQCQLERHNWRIDLYHALYVAAQGRQIPDPLLPLPEKIRLQRETDQAVFVDLFVPFDAAAGTYRGKLTVSDGREIPLELTVLAVQLPRRASFLCEMNGYGLPDHVDEYYALQQVAYDHRVHANILHYSHNTAAPGARKSNLDMRLRSGRRMDNKRYDGIEPGAKQAYWDDFAEAFGPYFDGSLFQQGHRGPIPAPGFYLTFHESWPLNCRAYFNGDLDAYQAFADKPVYAETYVNVLADFVRLAKSKGWTDAGFQVYFNNKGSLNDLQKAPWILDEPASFWDYRALQFYGELTDRGQQDNSGIGIDYRIDISRPEYCRGQLDGRGDLWVVSSSAFQNYRRLVTDRIEQDGLKVWVYGTSNPVHESNRQLQAWALDAWRHGATGLVPWQTVDKTGRALQQADQLGLFIFDKTPDGKTAIRHSTRLKAYREAEQLIEYLLLVQQRQQWSASQMRAFIDHYVNLAGSVRKQNDDDAGTAEYDRQALLKVDTLRQAAIQLLR